MLSNREGVSWKESSFDRQKPQGFLFNQLKQQMAINSGGTGRRISDFADLCDMIAISDRSTAALAGLALVYVTQMLNTLN